MKQGLVDKTWFETTARANFEKWLLPRADEPLRCLQLGCFTGDASVWLLSHLPACTLVDVDKFGGSAELEGIDFAEVKSIYLDAVYPFGGRSTLATSSTKAYLRRIMVGCFDFIYVDADHRAPSVLRDAVLAWPMLVRGGLMAFDDYLWGQRIPYLQTPKPAIDAFVTVYGDELTVLECNAQVWVRKD